MGPASFFTDEKNQGKGPFARVRDNTGAFFGHPPRMCLKWMTERKLLSFCDHSTFQEEGGGGGLMSFWKEKWRILKPAWRETDFRGWDGARGLGLTSFLPVPFSPGTFW